MRFTPDFLQRIKDALPLSSVIGRYVPLQRTARDAKACCPFHKEKTPSFYVHDDRQFYHCFGCGAHGDVFSFLTDHEKLSFPEAVERLAIQAGIPLPEESPQAQQEHKERASDFALLDAAATWFSAQLAGEQGFTARQYIKERGLSAAMVSTFRLGFAPDDRQSLRTALKARGFADDAMLRHGLLIQPENGNLPYARFRNRLMFPITDRRGRVIAFGGRIFGDGQPKYLNSPETPLFHKSHVLYNADRARKPAHEAKELLVVEGYMDVIALFQGGFEHAVAPLGTAVTEDHLHQCWQMCPEPVLCLDGDEAGFRAMKRVADLALPLLQPDKTLKFVLLPKGEDPDTLLRAKGRAAFRQLLAQATPLAQMLWRERTSQFPAPESATPEQKAALERDLLAKAERIGHTGVKQHYRDFFKTQCRELFFTRKPPAARATPASGWGWRSPRKPRPRRPHETLLLTLALRYPELLNHTGAEEDFATYPLTLPELEAIRHAILREHAAGEPISAEDLRATLLRNNPDMEKTLSSLMRPPIAGSVPDAAEARRLWEMILQEHADHLAQDFQKHQAAQLVSDPTEERWQAFLESRRP